MFMLRVLCTKLLLELLVILVFGVITVLLKITLAKLAHDRIHFLIHAIKLLGKCIEFGRSYVRYNDKNTYTASASYSFTDDWKATYKFEYKKLDSNEPTGEYTDVTNSLTVSRSF